LLGENSSGKTTLLAAISAALNHDFPSTENLFNRAPFELGSFDTIATYRGGKYGRATTFSLGWLNDNHASLTTSIKATFKSKNGTPRVDSMVVKQGLDELKVQAVNDNLEFQFSYHLDKQASKTSTSKPKVVKFKAEQGNLKAFRLQDAFRYYLQGLGEKVGSLRKSPENLEVFSALSQFAMGDDAQHRPHATALAPLRTRPRRTYDELNEEFKPEGDHIPLVLARLLSTRQEGKNEELDALMRYGAASGLFEKIDVKRMGKRPSDPFQVRVKTKGPDANLIDVGYGVSQSLPIVVESIMAPENEVLLVQQPEVHLHPKAQAALGTFFVDIAATTSKQFVIETHSDHLVDRVRLAISEGKIPASKVQLIYLERHGLDIKVHELVLDQVGNIIQAPPTYRNFFLEEEMKLMSRAS
jgi:energy-coupling factor transporter ATP-binding protein EcfA2